MKKNTFLNVILLCLMLFCCGCATTHQISLRDGLLPSNLHLTEQKMLEDTRKFEDFIYRSGAVYEDMELEAYINEIGRKMVPQYMNNEEIKFKFKVIKDPDLNAFAMPHGGIYVTTGLLARLENEAQLAFILGHEIAHVINRDLLYFTEGFHNKTVAAKIFDLILTPASVFYGFGGLCETGVNLIYAASVSGYGRSQESRADTEGFESMTAAGYRPGEAEKIFDIFMAESEKYNSAKMASFLSSHPSNVDRKQTIGELLNTCETDIDRGIINGQNFKMQTKGVKLQNVSLNIKSERYQHALDNLESLLDCNQDNAQVHFYLGECYRLMAENRNSLRDELNREEWKKIRETDEEKQKTEWRQTAEKEYKLALSCNENYVEPYRGLGFLYEANNRKDQAVIYLEKYLADKPSAKDKRFVKSRLERIIKSLEEENAQKI